MLITKNRFLFLLCLLGCGLQFPSCTNINLYEKVVSIPGHQWQSSFKPEFTFAINDTTAPYQLYIVLRHNNKYQYNNIWVNLYAKPEKDTARKIALELPLANKEGWLGTGMDDIFEHRIKVGSEAETYGFMKWDAASQAFLFQHPGKYVFTLEQIMRDDPLQHVMNAGIRLEKKMP